MPKILLKRTSVSGDTFSLARLSIGEVGVNTADGKLFVRSGNGSSLDTIVDIADAIKNLGFTPVDRAGDTMTGTLTLRAGSATAPPLKLQQGNVLTVPQPHSLEWDGAFLYMINNGAQRKTIAYQDSSVTGTSSGWTTPRQTTFSGDINGTLNLDGLSNTTSTLTLPNINSTTGVFGDDRSIPVVTVNSKGQITNIITRNIELTTTDVSEGTNLYFAPSRARAAISASGALIYNSTTGVMSYTEPARPPVAVSGNYSDLVGKPILYTNSEVSSTTEAVIDAWSSANYRGAKYLVMVNDTVTNNFQTSELLLLHNDNAVFYTEYGVINTNLELGEISGRFTNSSVELLFSANFTSTFMITVTRTMIPR